MGKGMRREDVLICFGAACFRGPGPGPVKELCLRLQHFGIVLNINEYYSSQTCCLCGAWTWDSLHRRKVPAQPTAADATAPGQTRTHTFRVPALQVLHTWAFIHGV